MTGAVRGRKLKELGTVGVANRRRQMGAGTREQRVERREQGEGRRE